MGTPRARNLDVRFVAIWLMLCGAALAQTPAAAAASPASSTNAAASSAPQDPYNRTSPENAVWSFLEACREKNYAAATRYLDLRELSPEARREQGPRLAQELGQALESDPQFDVAALSRDPQGDVKDNLAHDRERVATMHAGGQTFDLQLERTQLGSGVWVWRFAPDTVEEIPSLTQRTATRALERYLPSPLVSYTFLDTALWQWIALLAAALAAAAVGRLFSRAVLALVRPALARVAPRLNWASIGAFVGPVQLLLATALFRMSLAPIEPSAILRFYLARVLALLSIFAIAWLCARAVDGSMIPVRAALAARRATVTHSVVPMAARVAKLTVYVFAFIALLASWGYNTRTLLAGLGIGGIAIALAAQKTVENLFGGLAVITDHPVYVGDFCKFGNSTGTVEDIGLRSTRIRTPDRTLLTVPNGQFSAVAIENFSRQDKMLFNPTLNLRRDTTPDQVRTILAALENILKNHPKVEPGNVPVRFVGVGTYSLDMEVGVYILTNNGDEFMTIRQDLLLRILDAIASAGTALALPTQASIVYSSAGEPGQESAGVQGFSHNGNA
jgi:MscS family membrane protein